MDGSDNSDSTPEFQAGNYLAKYGLTVLGHGYPIIPVERGSKAPANGKGWQRTKATPAIVQGWCGRHAEAGIGIIARTAPGADLDVYDPPCAEHMEAWCLRELGPAPIRFGERPKRLLTYRTSQPFPKVQSRDYLDGQGRKARVEVLCDGQQ